MLFHKWRYRQHIPITVMLGTTKQHPAPAPFLRPGHILHNFHHELPPLTRRNATREIKTDQQTKSATLNPQSHNCSHAEQFKMKRTASVRLNDRWWEKKQQRTKHRPPETSILRICSGEQARAAAEGQRGGMEISHALASIQLLPLVTPRHTLAVVAVARAQSLSKLKQVSKQASDDAHMMNVCMADEEE